MSVLKSLCVCRSCDAEIMHKMGGRYWPLLALSDPKRDHSPLAKGITRAGVYISECWKLWNENSDKRGCQLRRLINKDGTCYLGFYWGWSQPDSKEEMMYKKFAIAILLLSAPAFAVAQTNPPNTTATRPTKTGPEQTSVPNASPPATRTQTTGATNQDPTVKKMNDDEKKKVEKEGK